MYVCMYVCMYVHTRARYTHLLGSLHIQMPRARNDHANIKKKYIQSIRQLQSILAVRHQLN